MKREKDKEGIRDGKRERDECDCKQTHGSVCRREATAATAASAFLHCRMGKSNERNVWGDEWQ